MTLPKLKQGDLVEILWHDAAMLFGDKTWVILEDVNWEEQETEANAMQTTGYYLGRTKDSVFVSQTYCTNGCGMGIFMIPIGCIRVLERK